MVSEKKCVLCEQVKPLDEFYLISKGGTAHLSRCKPCQSLFHKARREAARANPKPVTATEKRCSRCRQVKILDDFDPQVLGKYGRSSWCRECTSLSRQEYNRTHKTERANYFQRTYVRRPKLPEPLPEGHKRCWQCKEIQPLQKFSDTKTKRDGKSSRCKKCDSVAHKEWRKTMPLASKESQRRWGLNLKLKVLSHYGGICYCCGESDHRFLNLDHIFGEGEKHRKEVGAGTRVYSWALKNNYPPIFQVACYNCNCARYHNGGICPHQTERERLLNDALSSRIISVAA